ncbi:uncharacterized protein LOC128497671 [Spea bombifrons]|uniref:uncharacterized protein LOC128497671 n=1 Tax=Spea bombifrons TaxID=233779 RepID=UPI00234A2D30|nr:uncharacterized protein LOC128497671 [Spea bombifrons]
MRYQLTYYDATVTCQQDFGAALATREQLSKALQSGLEECRAGWITSAEVAYPRINKHWNCGENRTGIISYGIRQNLLEKWDVFCYKLDDDCSHYNLMYVKMPIAETREQIGIGFSDSANLKQANESTPSQTAVALNGKTKFISTTQSSSLLNEYITAYEEPKQPAATWMDFPQKIFSEKVNNSTMLNKINITNERFHTNTTQKSSSYLNVPEPLTDLELKNTDLVTRNRSWLQTSHIVEEQQKSAQKLLEVKTNIETFRETVTNMLQPSAATKNTLLDESVNAITQKNRSWLITSNIVEEQQKGIHKLPVITTNKGSFSPTVMTFTAESSRLLDENKNIKKSAINDDDKISTSIKGTSERSQPSTFTTPSSYWPMKKTSSLPERKRVGQRTYANGTTRMISAYGPVNPTSAPSLITPSLYRGTERSTSLDMDKTLDTCGGLLQRRSGRFQSPGFPQSYDKDMNCKWVIEAPLGFYVTLDFISLIVEEHTICQYDHVLVYDGKESDGQLIGRFCGLQVPSQLQTTSNIMTVIMRSDSTEELAGILVEFTSWPYTPDGIRLKRGQTLLEGEVEVEYHGIRGSICAKQWSNKNARVVCRQLGYFGPALATRMIGEEGIPMAHSFVNCSGDEATLEDCSLKNSSSCDTKERAGVICQEPPILQSCAALKEAGISDSGRYFIDPDGAGQGVSPFNVYCDMSSATGITVISHDSERRLRVTPCKEAGCYRRELKYNADISQLTALTKVSDSCEQFVRLDCRHIRFLESGWGWWVSRDGKKMNHWGGANTITGGCACGRTGSCSSPDKLCNCDSNDHIWRTDDGFLRDKDALPVHAVHFGDTDDFPVEMAYHTVGKLRCRGQGKSSSNN